MESNQSRKECLSKAETVEQLRNTIGQLEGIIKELDTITVEQLPESPSLETLVDTTEKLEQAIADAKQVPTSPPPEASLIEKIVIEPKPRTNKLETSSEATSPETTSEQPEPPEVISPPEKLAEATAIPKSKLQKKKWLISGLVAVIAIAFVTLALQFLPSQSIEVVAVTPKEIIVEAPIIAQEPEIVDRQVAVLPEPVKNPTISESEIVVETETTEEVIPEATVIVETETTKEVIPEATVVVETETTEDITPKATPPIKLTPEQNLIAAIAERVNKITTSYEPDLLTTIEANLNLNQLVITVDNQWYELNSDRQDKISNEILKRSRQLAFEKLIIQNQEGKLLARNPVIGNNMVIFQRNNES